MHYSDLRDFIGQLERFGELRRVKAEVSPRLEMTEICDRVLRWQEPASQSIYRSDTEHLREPGLREVALHELERVSRLLEIGRAHV